MIYIFNILLLLIFTIIINKYLTKLKLHSNFNDYINYLNRVLLFLRDKKVPPQSLLDEISRRGLVLIFKLFLFLIPYLLFFIYYNSLQIHLLINVILASLPYMILLKSR